MTISPPKLKVGQIAYFVHLHLDTVTLFDKQGRQKDCSWYKVEGKRRPMIVQGEPVLEREVWWYRVVPLTSKPGKGRTRVGRIVDPEKVSYAIHDVQRMPECLFDGHGTLMAELDPIGLANITKTILVLAQGGRLP